MKRILATLMMISGVVLAQTDDMKVNANTGVVKKTSSNVGSASKPFDWNAVNVTRLPHSVTLFVDGAGGVLTTGPKNPVKIPYAGTLKGWVLVSDQTGNITVDVQRLNDGNPGAFTSIVGSGTKPALSASNENSSETFTNWTSTTLAAKDKLRLSLSGISSVTYIALTLYYQ